MDQHDTDNLPPELDELGTRMSMESPVASDRALDSAMTRAQGARGARKSFLWRSKAPRAGRRSVAAVVAGFMAIAGLTGVTVVGATAGGTGGGPITVDSGVTTSDCSADALIKVQADIDRLVNACVLVLTEPGADAVCPEGFIRVDVALGQLTQTCVTLLEGQKPLIDLPIGSNSGGGEEDTSLLGGVGNTVNSLLGGLGLGL